MSDSLHQLVQDSRSIFWGVPEAKLASLDRDAIVEAILNYGTIDSVKRLFALLSIRQVADIFYRQTSLPRPNYHPQTANFFNLYFKRHVA